MNNPKLRIMKNVARFKLVLIAFFLIFIGSITQSFAQDKVIMLNGEEKIGKVTSIGSDNIKFVYDGEDLQYEFLKTEIEKIVFASGRTEVYNDKVKPSTTAETSSNAIDRRNKIAILPFEVTTNDPDIDSKSMGTRIQNDCVFIFRENVASIYQLQDAMTTEALLSQNNIDHIKLRSIPPKQMAELLGVEYVLYGTCDVQNKGAHNYGSSVTTYKEKEDKNSKSHNKNTKGSEVTSTNSTSTIEYDTHITLSVFNDQGNNVYSETRNPFGSGTDTYSVGIKYLIKRSPFGTKH